LFRSNNSGPIYMAPGAKIGSGNSMPISSRARFVFEGAHRGGCQPKISETIFQAVHRLRATKLPPVPTISDLPIRRLTQVS
jgi:hypothetical protein